MASATQSSAILHESTLEGKHVTVKLAAEKDYDDAISIGENIYEGNDYLKSYYKSFIKRENVLVFMACVDGQAAHLTMTFHMEQDQTVLLMAQRTKKKFQRKGLQNLVFGVVRNYFNPIIPPVSFISIGVAGPVREKMVKKGNEICRWHCLVINTDMKKIEDSLNMIRQNHNHQQLVLEKGKSVSTEKIYEHLTNSGFVDKFPSGMFVASYFGAWTPYKLTKCNLIGCRSDNETYLFLDRNNKALTSVVFGAIYMTEAEPAVLISYYGESTLPLMLDSIIDVLTHLKSSTKELMHSFSCYIHFPLDLDFDKVLDVINMYKVGKPNFNEIPRKGVVNVIKHE